MAHKEMIVDGVWARGKRRCDRLPVSPPRLVRYTRSVVTLAPSHGGRPIRGPRQADVICRYRTPAAAAGSAKFGSATMTSWPSASRQRATHSLSVEASIRFRARAREPSTAATRSGSVWMPPLDDLSALSEDVDLTFPLVHVDANMVRLAPPRCGVDRDVLGCGGFLRHHVKREASRFIHPQARPITRDCLMPFPPLESTSA